MGLWDWRKNSSSTPSFGGGSSFDAPPIDLSGLGGGGAPQQNQGLLQRFDLNKTFNDLSGQTAGLFATAGTAPAKFAETPFSFADTAIKRIPGGAQALAQAGQGPGGQLLGAAGEVVNRVSNFVPAIINSKDAQLFKVVGDLPDSTPMTDALVRQLQHVPDSGVLNALTEYGKQTGGGLFGIGNRPMTVGEFKNELLKRGFFNDASGKPVTPDELLAQLRGGGSIYNFGDKQINDNPLVDMAGRLATDPTNALFLVPGGGLVKGAEMAAKAAKAAEGIRLGAEAGNLGTRVLEMAGRVIPRGRLIEAGAVAPRLPAPIIAAEAIARGEIQYSTLKGLGELLKSGAGITGRLAAATVQQGLNPANYFRAAEGATGLAKTLSRARSFTRSSAALGATNMAVNRLTNTINDALGGNVPILKDVAQFSADVENDRPLSSNSAWMLASAMAFPYGEVVHDMHGKVIGEKVKAVGRNEFDPFIKAAGGHEALLTSLGGPQGTQDFFYHIDKQIIRDRLGDSTVNNITGAQSAPDAATRVNIGESGLQDLTDIARRGGTISGKDRYAEALKWARAQGGFGDKPIDYTPSWEDIAARWRQFQPVQQFMSPYFREYGGMIQGQREGVLFTEQVDSALTRLKAATAPDGTVPNRAIMSVLGDHPQLNTMDHTGYWQRFALPDMPAPTLKSVQAKLRSQRESAVPIREYFSDVIANEQAAPSDLPPPPFEPTDQKIARLKADLATTTDANGVIRPGQTDRAHTIQKQLEDETAKLNHVAWIDRGQQEKAAGVDPVLSRQMQEQAGKALGVDVPASMDANSPEFIAWARKLDYEVAQINPSYQAEHAPINRVIAAVRPDDPQFIAALQARTALGEWLHHDGPLSKLAGFYDALLGPIKQKDLYRQSKQAVYNEFVPLGAKPEQVSAWLSKLEERVRTSTLEGLGQRIQFFRGIHALPAGWLLDAARETLPPSLIAKIGDKGVLNRFDRAGSSFYRAAQQGVREGSKFSSVLEGFYRAQQNLPLAGTRRLVGRTVYPLFRFMLDPRWILMNSVEAQFLGSGKDGFAGDPASTAATSFLNRGQKITEIQAVPDSGLMFGKRYATMIGKSFDKRSVDSAEATLNTIGRDAPEFAMLRQAIKREADQRLAAGAIDAKEHAKQVNASNRDLAVYMNDLLYRIDKRGVKAGVQKTIDEAANDWLTLDERRVLAPLLGQVATRNVELWTDVKRMYTGTADRSAVERTMNSYWLYWPISYQIKATKWLANIMLNGSFGHDNGALLAGKYALWQQQHEQQMKDNPAYAAFFNQNRTLWYIAQMLLPIGPQDIGFSLGKQTSTAGALVQNQINDWTGSRLGLFTLSKRADGALPTLQWYADMGPIYTQELLQRAAREPIVKSVLGPPTPPLSNVAP